jgi:putative salt-induced outer membrane protein
VLVGAIVLGLAIPLPAQEPSQPASEPPPRFWEHTTIGFGFNSSSGNLDAKSLNARLESVIRWSRGELDATMDADFTEVKGQDLVDRYKLDSALRRSFARNSRNFGLLHAWLNRDQAAGIDFRHSFGLGVGRHVIDQQKGRLTLEGGVAMTTEELAGGDVRESFATLFFDPTLHWSLTATTSFQQQVNLRYNFEESEDHRIHSDSSIGVQITRRIGIQFSVLVDYDNLPVAGRKKTDVQTSTNVLFTLNPGPN